MALLRCTYILIVSTLLFSVSSVTTTLVVLVMHLVWCVFVCTNNTVTFEQNNLWPRYLSGGLHWLYLGNVEGQGQSLWSQEVNNSEQENIFGDERTLRGEAVAW